MRILLAALLLAVAGGVTAQMTRENASSPGLSHGIRGPIPLTDEPVPPPFPKVVNDDQRKTRNYPMQPPLIPHQIDNYQVDLRFNKCMDCHGRARTQESGAPMVSVTHYQDRDGNMLGEISARRYFCTGCHVMQTDARVPVKNTFVDFYEASRERAPATQPSKGAGADGRRGEGK
jgi:nitrate reductase (cytochrome), electron transfer subunit